MYSKLKNKRKPQQFEDSSKKNPAALKQGYKSSAKKFDIERVAQPSKSLMEWAASLGQRTKRSAEEVAALKATAEAKRSGREVTKAAKRVLKAPTLSIEEPIAEPESPKRKRGRPKKAAAAPAAPSELPKQFSGYNPTKELTERADKLKKEAAAASQRGDAKAEAAAAFELLEVYKEMKDVSGIKQVERIIQSKGFEKKKKRL